MRTSVRKESQPQKQVSSSLGRASKATTGPNYHLPPILCLQGTSGNLAAREPLELDAEDLEVEPTATRFGHDFSRIPVYAETPSKIQAKRTISTLEDAYAQKPDRGTDQVMRRPAPACSCDESCPKCQSRGHRFRPEKRRDRLTLSQLDDYFEKEADGVADDVMRISGSTPDSPVTKGPDPQSRSLTRQEQPHQNTREGVEDQPVPENVELEVSPQTETEVRKAVGGGAPMPEPLRDFFEPRFGHDFSHVRIHVDQVAASAEPAGGCLHLRFRYFL